ncbi:MAG: LacI family DNA-binding transcriptional regulator, partial [Brevinema sp.]
MMNKVSIRDVAQKAGVSISAVSLAYNKPYQLSESTRKKILTIADEIGYAPTIKYQYDSKLVVIAVPTDPSLRQFVSSFTYSIIQKFSEHSYKAITLSYKSDTDFYDQLKAITNKEQIEGIIAVVNNVEMQLKKHKIPMVIISANASGENIDIGFDFMSDIEDILTDFQQNEKQNIAIVTSHLLFHDLYIQSYMKIFEHRYQEYFNTKFNPESFCLLSESRSDLDLLKNFYEKNCPDAWIIVGDYALNYVQNVVQEELQGFVIMEEGKSYIKLPSNK